MRWRLLRLARRAGRRAVVAIGNSVDLFEGAESRFKSVESRRRVVFSFGERRSSCVYNGMISCSFSRPLPMRDASKLSCHIVRRTW